MFNIFRRKPPPPLNEALQLITQASNIVMLYKQNKHYMPTEEDLALLQRIEEAFHSGYANTLHVRRCLGQRADAKPEGAAKWRDKEIFDYHLP